MHTPFRLFLTRASLGVLAFVWCGPAIHAQIVIMPLSPSGPSPAAVARDLSTGTKRATPASSLESALAAQRPIFQYGNLTYTGNLSYRYTDGSRLRTETGNDRDTAIQAFVFSGSLSTGRHWTLSHTTTASFYENEEFRDPVDHSFSASAGYVVGEWSVAGSFGYSRSNDTILEIGAQTTRDTYSSGLSFGRQLGDRTSIDLSVNYSLGVATGLVSGNTLSTSNSINYQFSPKLRAGAGFSYGWSFVDLGADANFVRPQFHFGWQPTTKTSLNGSVGYEYRTFRSGGSSRLVNPVYTVSMSYRPFDPTSFSISANASENPSFFVNRSAWTTGLNFSVQQRVLQRLFFSGNYSMGRTEYVAIDRGLAVDRKDEHDSYGLSLSTAFLQRASLSLSYSQVKNVSDATRFSLSTHSYSLALGYRF